MLKEFPPQRSVKPTSYLPSLYVFIQCKIILDDHNNLLGHRNLAYLAENEAWNKRDRTI